ncbi:MAG: glutathione S-transferase C-terminal domain-containing protein, partial [Rhodospirillaceae bacterium]
PDDGAAIFDSGVICEYLETLGRPPALIPADPAARVRVRQVEALADGVCDAVVLIVLETHRPAAMQSADWIVRQRAKIHGGVAALATLLEKRAHFEGDDLTLADIAAACALRYIDLRLPDIPWRDSVANLVAFSDAMEARPSFQATVPTVQEIAAVR